MKRLFLALFILTMYIRGLFAQAVEIEKPMSMGLKNALSLEIKDLKVSKITDLWEDFMKQFDCKTKKDKKLDEYFSDNAKVYYIPSAGNLDVYARFSERGKSAVEANIFILENDNFLSSKANAEQMKGAFEFVRQFDVFVKKYQVTERMEDEQKKLKKLESDLRHLIKDNENLQKDIISYKDKINKAEADIKKNNSDQEKANAMINEQAKVIEQVKTQLDGLK